MRLGLDAVSLLGVGEEASMVVDDGVDDNIVDEESVIAVINVLRTGPLSACAMISAGSPDIFP